MIETAIIRIRGERFLFQAADNLARKSAERNETPGARSSFSPAGQTTRGVRQALSETRGPSPARSFDNLLHASEMSQ